MHHIPIGPIDKVPPGFIDSNEAAHRLGLSASTLATLRQQKKGPPWFTWCGWRAIYQAADVVAYAEKLADQAREKVERAKSPPAPEPAEPTP